MYSHFDKMYRLFSWMVPKKCASLLAIFHIGVVLLKEIGFALRAVCTITGLRRLFTLISNLWSKSFGPLVEEAKKFVIKKVWEIQLPKVSIRVEPKNISFDSVTFVIKVSIDNPYIVPIPIPIGSISYLMKSAGRVITSGNIPDPGMLKAKGTTTLYNEIKVPYSILMSLVLDTGADWDIDYELDLGLTFDLPLIGDVTIPISYTDEIKLPTFPKLF